MTFDQFGKSIPTLQAAATDLQAARMVWSDFLSHLATDPRCEPMLAHIVTSVVIDYITNRIIADDAYALVIADRIHTLLGAATAPTGPATPASAA